jgi:hypothetical protein
MDKLEKDFRSAGRILNLRKAARILWGCAKAMTSEQRQKLYKSMEAEHIAVTKERLQFPDLLPKLVKQQLLERLDEGFFGRTLEAKALLKFGIGE